jgi:CubicO group peptidase (beta-lactamase class C family)
MNSCYPIIHSCATLDVTMPIFNVTVSLFIIVAAWPFTVDGQPASLNEILEPIRATHKLTALAAAVVRNGEIVASGAVGSRKVGSPERVTLADKWHIGSCTKSMTAALAGMLVDKGQWRWDIKVTEMFPNLAGKILPEWRGATLEEFLTQYSGAGNEDCFDEGLLARASRPPLEQRAQFIHDFFTQRGPSTPPGTDWKYDNANYSVVGHAIELRLNKPWETVMRERLFKPLGMDSAGFGPPASGKAVDQPWGHVIAEDGKVTPMPPDAMGDTWIWVPELGQKVHADNPAALWPGGGVHCSIGDLAKYAAWQLRGARGKGTLLKAATFERLHTRLRKEEHYACGWEVSYRDWAGGDALFHGGSNGTFMTAIWLAPKKDFAVVVCSNLGGTDCQSAVDGTVSALIEAYLDKQ